MKAVLWAVVRVLPPVAGALFQAQYTALQNTIIAEGGVVPNDRDTLPTTSTVTAVDPSTNSVLAAPAALDQTAGTTPMSAERIPALRYTLDGLAARSSDGRTKCGVSPAVKQAGDAYISELENEVARLNQLTQRYDWKELPVIPVAVVTSVKSHSGGRQRRSIEQSKAAFKSLVDNSSASIKDYQLFTLELLNELAQAAQTETRPV